MVMSADTPAKEQDKFVLRLPDGMRDRLKFEAEANNRSMNAEIVRRLERSLLPKEIQLEDFSEADIRDLVWREMYNNFHRYRSDVINSIEQKLARNQNKAEPSARGETEA